MSADNNNNNKRKALDITEKHPPFEIKNKDLPLAIVCITEEGDFRAYICEDVKLLPPEILTIIGHLDVRCERRTNARAFGCLSCILYEKSSDDDYQYNEEWYIEANPTFTKGSLIKIKGLTAFKLVSNEEYAEKVAEKQHTIIVTFEWT